jgi:GDP-L-fucose synthase
MKSYTGDGHVNVGSGKDIPIIDLTRKVAAAVGCDSPIEQDVSKPDGTPRKLMDVSKLTGMGWSARTSLDEGLAEAYAWFVGRRGDVRT